MSTSITTILIIGATSGIGEVFARRFHLQGKKVIITGRRQDRLDKLKTELPGLETYNMDNTDIPTLPKHVDTIMKQHPDINTVWINSGDQHMSDFKNISSTTDEAVVNEITLNVTAPTILARHFIPHLLKLGSTANLMITGSGLGITPMGLFPVYCPTKSFTHSFLVGLRQSLKDTNVNVWELVAPAVGPTGMTEKLEAAAPEMFKKLTFMPMEEFVREIEDVLKEVPASGIKEIAPGTAKGRIDAWRGSVGAMLEKMGMGG